MFVVKCRARHSSTVTIEEQTRKEESSIQSLKSVPDEAAGYGPLDMSNLFGVK